MTGAFGLGTFLLLWLGAVVVVRGERVSAGRVDVTVQRRLLGIIPIGTERLTDVVRAGIEQPGGSSLRSQHAAPKLRLALRDGRVWRSQSVRYAAGTPPWRMARPIQEFVDRSSAPSLRLWWVQWVLAALSVPFLLIFVLFLAAGINMARRELPGAR